MSKTLGNLNNVMHFDFPRMGCLLGMKRRSPPPTYLIAVDGTIGNKTPENFCVLSKSGHLA